MSDKNQKKDLFAEITAVEQSVRQAELVQPGPAELPKCLLQGAKSDSSAAFGPATKLDNAEKLQGELAKHRRWANKFLKNFAADVGSTRIRRELCNFDWRKEAEADQKDFQRVLVGKGHWEKVEIPHYGGPLGRAVTYYRTTFKVSKPMLSKGVVFVCFKGVDYKAHAFVNGAYLGSHEGFFAPFEFEFTHVAKVGENTLVVKVENDAICMGNQLWGDDEYEYEGDKLYAATGPGYDDPQVGWHHCPPGMGIYQDVYVEARAPIHVHDIFVHAVGKESLAEAWIEVFNCGRLRKDISLALSIFGQNFRKTIFRDREFNVEYAGPTLNHYRISFDLPETRLWQPDSPWLYQIQVKVLDKKGKILDASSRQFGMRSFRMDEASEPKGRFYLNDQEIRLRGANTMGHMQQCVMKEDWDQLRDDILLAKICHINFFRLTQRPVQSEIYDFCDRLGMMTQTDLPLFGVLRRNQFCEAIRQAEEMERLVRNHACNIVDSYINEPFPKSWPEWDRPQRNLSRAELESFFAAADQVIRLANPDRVIKPVDGDYDPPAPSLPDNHCYCGWYGGHGVDLGKLHKGYWQKIKPGWFYGCGEFGAEGLESVELMRKYYPKDWLPQTLADQAGWSPDRIIRSQTGGFHYMWFDTQSTLTDWVKASQAHQAWTTRLMTEAFRRDSRMHSMAIHLFIDAFPAGWMKAIMDVDRQPKPAYFAYREALTPLMVNLRTDRYSFFAGEQMQLEAWICNDTNVTPKNAYLHYQLEMDGKAIFSQRVKANTPVCSSRCLGIYRPYVPEVKSRSVTTARIGLLDGDSHVLHDSSICLDIFPREGKQSSQRPALIIGSKDGKACQLVRELGLQHTFCIERIKCNDLMVIDDMAKYEKSRNAIESAVRSGARAIFLEIPAGDYDIASSKVKVEQCVMGSRHFVSRNTGHPMVADFAHDDFRFWFDPSQGYVTPILETVFAAPTFDAILISGIASTGVGLERSWRKALVAGERKYGKGTFRVCQLALAGRLNCNPVATIFANRLLNL